MKTVTIALSVMLGGLLTCQAQNTLKSKAPVAKAPNPAPLKPGLYFASPYSVLVLLPGPDFDVKMAKELKRDFGRMPVVKPPLRLNPIVPK